MSLNPPHNPLPDGLPVPRRYFAVGLLLTALVVVVLDGTMANVALPSIAASFGADASTTVLVVSSYQLAVLIALLPCGALGEIYGPRRVFLIGIAIFTAASATCAFAWNLPVLIGARFVQGLGGGALMSLTMMNLRYVVPQRRLGAIIGFNAMTVSVSIAAGPALAGAMLSVAPWQWLFAINIPLGLTILVGGRMLAPTPGTKRPLNAATVLTSALMFMLFFIGADRITRAPVFGVLLVVAAVGCLLLLLHMERDSRTPLIPTDLLASPPFRIAVIASVTCFSGQMLSYIAIPFYLQHTLNMSAALAGLYMMPWPIATVIVAPIAGRLADRFKAAWLCGIGGILFATGLLIAGLSPPDPKAVLFLVGTVFAGAGFGLFQTPNNRTLLLSAPKARAGAAGAMQGTARLTGQTIGAIIMSIIFTTAATTNAPNVALVIAGLCVTVSALASFSRVRFETTGGPG